MMRYFKDVSQKCHLEGIHLKLQERWECRFMETAVRWLCTKHTTVEEVYHSFHLKHTKTSLVIPPKQWNEPFSFQ